MTLKPNFTEKILEFLQERAEISVDMLKAMFLSPRELSRDTRRFLTYGPRPFKTSWAEQYRKHRVYAATLSRLKRQGLVTKKRQNGSSMWRITKKGSTRLEKIKKRHKNPLSLTTAHFKPARERCWVIITYDIPEKEKAKRGWLRGCLKSLQFSFLQKSVWIGNRMIPEDFIKALKERNILSGVHIFLIKKGGTIEQLPS